MKKLIVGALGISLLFSSFTGVVSASSSGFTDIKGHWAESIINEAVERGITSGISADKFAPNDNLTYEQFMTMLARMLTEKNFIEDKVSGCKMVLTNYNDEYKVSNGDVKKLKEYRDNYLKNNPELNQELIKESNSNISDFNSGGVCWVRSWINYKTNDMNSLSYVVSDKVLNKTQNWAKSSLTTVPYVAGFTTYYDFISNNGKNIKDFNYSAFKYGLTPFNYYEWTGQYQKKRITNVYDNLNTKYIENKEITGLKSITREDMALILYSFLNYDEQKLITYKQDNFYYLTFSSSSNIWANQDLNYKSFKSKYTDLPKYFQINTMDANGIQTKFPYYTYIPERIFAKNAIGIDNKEHTNYEATHTNEGIRLTSRAVILAVSDAGLISGSGNKFNPEKSLTRAEGVAVALKLDDFLKKRYNFLDANSNSKNINVNESDNLKNTLTKYYDAVYAKDVDAYNGTWLNLSEKEKEKNISWFKDYTFKYAMDSFQVVSLENNQATVEADIITTKINTDNKDFKYIEVITKQKFKIFLKNTNENWKIEKMELVGNMQQLPNPNPEQI